MVEFALALPILLLLLYGMLETARLLFIYASTVTAARQAVRYGSATGISPNGVPYYNDCAGIRAAAQAVGFLNRFENDDIMISYDGGVNNASGNPIPLNPTPTCGSFENVKSGDRIIVSVSTDWAPLVPIVPFSPFTITSTSSRTILAPVSIFVTSPAYGWQGSGGGILTIGKAASPATYSTAGQIITYTYTLTNTGTGELLGPFAVSDNKVKNVKCANAPSSLAPGASLICSGSYQITQADLDAGSVTNVATATAAGAPAVNQATVTITADTNPSLQLTMNPTSSVASTAGTKITYTYTLHNTGNVTLTSPYKVSDNRIAKVNCSAAASPLAPGASTTCTATYQITGNDIRKGSVVNQAVATAKFGTTTVTSNTATATVYTTKLVISINPTPPSATLPNQVIRYTYTIWNATSTTAKSLNVTSRLTPSINCPSSSILPGRAINCTATYTVTQADLDTGGLIVNTASATANNGAPMFSNTAVNNLPIAQNPSISILSLTASPSAPTPPSTSLAAGTTITYTYMLKNTGNVTLTPPFAVSDNKTAITCADQTNLPPEASRICTGTYTVTNNDIVAESIINSGAASAKFGSQTITSAPASATVITSSSPRFSLTLSANPPTITQAGTTVIFTYTITNTRGKPLTPPFTITSSLLGTFTCGGTSPLAPGASTFCQNSYTSSKTITNTITAATAMDGAIVVSAAPPLPSVTVTANICSAGSLTLSAPLIDNNSKVAAWKITNNSGSTLHITSIFLTWDTDDNTHLSSVELPGGVTIWSGSDKDGTWAESGWWTIKQGSASLKMVFTKNKPTISRMTLSFDEAGCGPLSNP